MDRTSKLCSFVEKTRPQRDNGRSGLLSTRMHQVLLRASAEFGTGLFQRQDLQRRVAEALDETGRWEKRKSPLAAPLVVFFVLAMALFRSLSIKCLMLQFFLWMRDSTPGLPLRAVTPEAMCHARARLGTAPLKTLFQKLAVPARESARFQGLRPWAIDGVHMTMPDTPANVAEFGKCRDEDCLADMRPASSTLVGRRKKGPGNLVVATPPRSRTGLDPICQRPDVQGVSRQFGTRASGRIRLSAVRTAAFVARQLFSRGAFRRGPGVDRRVPAPLSPVPPDFHASA